MNKALNIKETLAPAFYEEPVWLDDLLLSSMVISNPAEAAVAKQQITTLSRDVLKGEVIVSDNLIASLDQRIAALDQLLSDQINEVLHHPALQALEATWRGLHYLTHRAETGPTLKIKVLNSTKRDLVRDMRTSPDFDQSQLFRQVYEEEFGTFGGSPFSCLVAGFEFGKSAEDIFLLDQLSRLGAAAHAPVITAADPSLFGLTSFADINRPRDLSKLFDTADYVKWRSLRDSDDARYLGMVIPHVLGRLPYSPEQHPVEQFNFVEEIGNDSHNSYLWMNAAYVYAANLADAFSKHGWLAAIRGVEGGGLVTDLPVHAFQTHEGSIANKCPTEVALTDRLEKQLSDLGFMGLVHCKNTDYAAFFSGQSVQRPKTYANEGANANARLSVQLPYVFAVSRIAHYLKAMVRDKIGSFASRKSLEEALNQWLTQYVLLDDTANQDAKARYPLREARVEVVESRHRPGTYKAAVFLRPHFQLDELTISLRLVTDLPSPTR